MSWKSEEIQAALEAALEDYGIEDAEPTRIRVHDPEPEEAPGRSFVVTVRYRGRELRAELPVGLANAYLADEEAAVDEFKRWTAEWAGRLGRPDAGG